MSELKIEDECALVVLPEESQGIGNPRVTAITKDGEFMSLIITGLLDDLKGNRKPVMMSLSQDLCSALRQVLTDDAPSEELTRERTSLP